MSKQKSITFNSEFIPSILTGLKTQTRRVMKVQPNQNESICDDPESVAASYGHGTEGKGAYFYHEDYSEEGWIEFFPCPYGEVGDHIVAKCHGLKKAVLEITNISVERIQSISEEDVTAEGIPELKRHWCLPNYGSLTEMFAEVWESIYGEDSFEENPWVWVLDFRVVDVKGEM